MDDKLKTAIEEMLEKITAEKITVRPGISISGGCINNAMSIQTSLGDTLFLKFNPKSPAGMFKAEADGLAELGKCDSLLIPKVMAYSDAGSEITPFILMEYIVSGQKTKSFWEDFGRGFAAVHRITEKRFGFGEDNFIGSSPQVNGWMDNWVDFYREKRLGQQIELAKKNNLWSTGPEKLWNILSAKLEELIGEPEEPASLLHGDLWSGNYIVGPRGEAGLIDPAVYYGNREADLAMTELFGGFDSRFYDAYRESYLLAPGYPDRVDIYKLYHLINHLNLF
ncbi:MAG: fructosamine kinase family protein, partial [Spirochaetota bacterium]|nr:fructosamine kinase family protein [Spirochaetota bacterium]